MSIFCPTESATYSLFPTQSTAMATGNHVPGRAMSTSGFAKELFPYNGCE